MMPPHDWTETQQQHKIRSQFGSIAFFVICFLGDLPYMHPSLLVLCILPQMDHRRSTSQWWDNPTTRRPNSGPWWDADDDHFSSESEVEANPLEDKRAAAAQFIDMLLGLNALNGPVTAEVVCVLSYWAALAGAHSDIGVYGKRPGLDQS